jgi:hypothetical protein
MAAATEGSHPPKRECLALPADVGCVPAFGDDTLETKGSALLKQPSPIGELIADEQARYGPI